MHSKGVDQPVSMTFLVYPAAPQLVGQTVDAALNNLSRRAFRRWTETDIAGHFIGTEVLTEIATASRLAADISVLNFNVTYEIGYAIGRKKPRLRLAG